MKISFSIYAFLFTLTYSGTQLGYKTRSPVFKFKVIYVHTHTVNLQLSDFWKTDLPLWTSRAAVSDSKLFACENLNLAFMEHITLYFCGGQ